MSLDLFECVALSEASRASGQPRVDREKGIIYRVKALGWESANGRRYVPEGVATALYEGRRVCVGHHRGPGERHPLDTYGLLEGISKEKDGVYAERLRLLNPAGEFEQRLMTAADVAPHLFGLSHTARGKERAGSHGKIIESVEHVESVDLVCDPATVRGLRESRDQPVKKKLKDLIESLKASRPDYSRALTEVAEAGIMSPDAPMDAPAEAPASEGDHKTALMGALKALCDEADSLDEGELMKKFKAILKLIKGEKAGGSSEGSESAAEESRRAADANLREENARLKARDLLRTAADEANVRLSENVLKAVRPNITEAEAKAFVNELKGAAVGGTQKPRSAAPITTPGQGGGKDVRESRTPPSDDELKAMGHRINGR